MTKVRPRVLLTTDAVGGVWTYSMDLGAGLLQAEVDVLVALLGPPPTPAQRSCAAASGLTLVDTEIDLDWLAADADSVRSAGRRLSGLAHAAGADLIHLNSPALAAGAAFGAPVVGGCHSCLSTWWKAVRGGAEPSDFQWRSDLLAQGYSVCDALIAPSAAFAADSLAIYGVAMDVVHNGRSPGGRKASSSEKQPWALTAGRLWDDAKNVRVLDQAAGRMRGRVTAAGPTQGPQGQKMEFRSLKGLGVLDDASLTEAMNLSAVFVSLASYEPFGLSVVEAAQAGCALVLSDIPTFRELWEDVAVFVPRQDPQAVADVLDRLLSDIETAQRLGEMAALRASTFNQADMVGRTLEIYQRVWRGRRRRSGAAA